MTLTCSSLAAACSAELDAGTWSSTLTRRNRLHVDVGAWRGAGVAEVRPSVALLCLREGARVATAREGAAGRRLGEVGQLAVVALARSSRARTRRRSSRSCPATDTTGVIRMRAAWLVELQVLRGYGRPEACVASSPLTLNVYHASHFTAGKDFFFALALTQVVRGSFVVKFFFALFPTALLLYQSISSRVVLSFWWPGRSSRRYVSTTVISIDKQDYPASARTVV